MKNEQKPTTMTHRALTGCSKPHKNVFFLHFTYWHRFVVMDT